jgi:hypothetical protein
MAMAVLFVTVVAAIVPVSARAIAVSKIVTRGGRFDTPYAGFGTSPTVLYLCALGRWSAGAAEKE